MDKEKDIQKLFNKACVKYALLHDGDRILIALSGGKDSLMLTRLLAQRARIYKPHIEVEAVHVVMDNIPYETDRTYLQDFCRQCGITLTILHSHFDESTDPRKTKCFLCAWNRRKAIFEYASSNGFNKVALGHHQDDIIHTLLMNMTFEGSLSTIAPILPLEHYPISLIRPLCLVPEQKIKDFASLAGFQKQKVACPYEQTTNRSSIASVFAEMERLNPEARHSLWHAVESRISHMPK